MPRRAIVHIHHSVTQEHTDIHRKSQRAYSSLVSQRDKYAHRCSSLTDKETHTRNVTCLEGRPGCGPLSAVSGLVNQVGARPLQQQLFPRGLRSHAFSWWLLAQLQSFNSPTVLHLPSPSISLPPPPSLLSFLHRLCLPYLLPTSHLILCPCPTSCLHFLD